jgi:hypothetical protein
VIGLALMGNGLVVVGFHSICSKCCICCDAEMGDFFLWFGAVAVRGYRVLACELLIQHVDYLMVGLKISLLCLRAAWLVND